MKIKDEQLKTDALSVNPYANDMETDFAIRYAHSGFNEGYEAGFRAAESADKWVPVSEIPEIGSLVDTYTPESAEQEEMYRYIAYGSLSTGFPPGVTHWRYPAPPQTETGL